MGFEVVVRPVVFPNIRPTARPQLPPDDPKKGIATISGGGGSLIDLPQSYSLSVTYGHSEVKRTFENVRISATNDDGSVDKSTYTEAEIATSMEFTPSLRLKFDPPKPSKSVELMGQGSRQKG